MVWFTYWSLVVFFVFFSSNIGCLAEVNIDGDQTSFNLQPILQPIDPMVYENFFTYAHLIDISYCITDHSRIQLPFRCNLDCEKYPDFYLLQQWCGLNNNCGYIATTNSNIFHYNADTNKKTIIVALRGTNSLKDSYADSRIDMISYENRGEYLPKCNDCRVHKGFHDYYRTTLDIIDSTITQELHNASDNYELVILGHSLGGSIALLLGLHYLDRGFDKLSVVTMGQPVLGNKQFVNWVDDVMGSRNELVHNSYARKFVRIIHKNDIVTTMPNIPQKYYQFDNQIYINTSSRNTLPLQREVVDCMTGDNPQCIYSDFTNISFLRFLSRKYLEIHLHYFRNMGFCNYSFFKPH